MFTGIIEASGKVIHVVHHENNIQFEIGSSISSELKTDQSVSHNGVCLTVESANNNSHFVTAIRETLLKSNLGDLQTGDEINLERCMQIGGRLDGHMVQGHVDTRAQLINSKDDQGSHILSFQFDVQFQNLIVEKGSISINGISLTVFNVQNKSFSVAIIPYTWKNTNLRFLKNGDSVNIEFDIIGKYVQKILGNNG